MQQLASQFSAGTRSVDSAASTRSVKKMGRYDERGNRIKLCMSRQRIDESFQRIAEGRAT
jgi:hypothetical protein